MNLLTKASTSLCIPALPLAVFVAAAGVVPAAASSGAAAAAPAAASSSAILVSARAAAPHDDWGDGRTRTPIKHLVVIFQENASFDHYFGTYPRAANPPGEPRFVARPGTPAVNGLTPALLTANPNAAKR